MKKIMKKWGLCCLFVVGGWLEVSGQVTEDMKQFIKSMEGLSCQVYLDGSHLAVGYGHHLRHSPQSWIRSLKLGETLPVEVCETLFEYDMVHLTGKGMLTVYKDIGWDYPSNVYDVMGSLIYNLGQHGLFSSMFYQLFKKGDYDKAFTELLLLKSRSRGVWNRRLLELEHLLKHYDPVLGEYE